MKKDELLKLVGEVVTITFKDGGMEHGVLGYTYCFSPQYEYRKPNYFYIGNLDFKVSEVKKVEVKEW